ncbi:MAG: hypothetical protein NC237_12445 [Eubacterium sp.]|nr:hypothetical protein [Eubacterium sp.]
MERSGSRSSEAPKSRKEGNAHENSDRNRSERNRRAYGGNRKPGEQLGRNQGNRYLGVVYRAVEWLAGQEWDELNGFRNDEKAKRDAPITERKGCVTTNKFGFVTETIEINEMREIAKETVENLRAKKLKRFEIKTILGMVKELLEFEIVD